ncbi:osteocrin-like [Megalops cyprinoides]|uniref:osteocrin-like n=1 Tax=Megalops cyprinoides TaxID=118141 RepID=UPI0018647894|nr:osteocrin-like [Megalops cyprinoides]
MAVGFVAYREHRYLDSEALEVSGSRVQSGEENSASKPTGRLLLLDQPVHQESALETKRKRSFTGGNAPLDRLSVSNMDVKGKKRKEVDLPRRRVSAPIDRIGGGRLPSTRG